MTSHVRIADVCVAIISESLPRERMESTARVLDEWLKDHFQSQQCADCIDEIGMPTSSVGEVVFYAHAKLLSQLEPHHRDASAVPVNDMVKQLEMCMRPERIFREVALLKQDDIDVVEIKALQSLQDEKKTDINQIMAIASVAHVIWWMRAISRQFAKPPIPLTDVSELSTKAMRNFLMDQAKFKLDSDMESKGRMEYLFSMWPLAADRLYARKNIDQYGMWAPTDVVSSSISPDEFNQLSLQNECSIQTPKQLEWHDDDEKAGAVVPTSASDMRIIRMSRRRADIWLVVLFAMWFNSTVSLPQFSFVNMYVIWWKDWGNPEKRALLASKQRLNRPRLPLIVDLGFVWGLHDSRSPETMLESPDICCIFVKWLELARQLNGKELENGVYISDLPCTQSNP